jgi:hypothetical protein
MEDTTLMDTAPQEQVNQVEELPTADNADNTVDAWSEDISTDDINKLISQEQTTDDTVATESSDTDTDVNLDDMYRQQLDSEAKLDKPVLIKYKGKVIDVNDANELRDLAERGIAATYKLQEAAEIRKQYEGITPEDIELLKRFKAGDTSVVDELAVERPTVDTTTEEVNSIASEILSAPYAEQFKSFVEVLPPMDKQQLSSNPRLLNGLKIDFESGTAQKLMPLVERYVSVNGMDFISAYTKAGKEVLSKDSARKKTMEQLSATPKPNTSVNTTPPTDVWSLDSETFRKLGNQIRR